MSKFSNDKRYILHNSGLHLFTYTLLYILFWDFGPIDLYDALILGLTQ
jgi:hypothetical protein